MDRMKTFFKYILALVLLLVFSNLVINGLLRTAYTNISDYEIDVSEVFVDITEAKASRWSGNLKGIVKNTSDATIENKYLKVSMLSKNKRMLGEKYIKIDKLEPDELKNFEVDFDYDNVKAFKIEYTDTMPEGVSFIELIKQNVQDLGRNLVK